MMTNMAIVVYFSCAVLSSGCAFMLFRGYRQNSLKLLLWSGLCFLGLALNNILFFVDVVLFPEINMWGPLLRGSLGALSGSILLYGFITELS